MTQLSDVERIAALTAHSTSYSPALARALNSTTAAILFGDVVRRGVKEWHVVDRHGVGMTTREKNSALSVLMSFGIIECSQEKDGDMIRVIWKGVIDLAADVVKREESTKIPMREKAMALFDDGNVTRESLLNEALDRCTKSVMTSKAVAQVLLSLWAEEWDKEESRVKLTAERMKHYRRAIADGYKPSEFAKAIIGMRCDEWSERERYSDWIHVTKYLSRWLDLYAQLQSGAISKTTMSSKMKLNFKTKDIYGVSVPLDYQWDQFDDRCLEDGRRFDPRSGKWHRSDDDVFDELAQFNPKRPRS